MWDRGKLGCDALFCSDKHLRSLEYGGQVVLQFSWINKGKWVSRRNPVPQESGGQQSRVREDADVTSVFIGPAEYPCTALTGPAGH